MSGFFFFVWFVTLIAFVVYWWKKKKARKAGGDDYQNSPEYVKTSKVKRIIGAICIASFVLGIATVPSTSPEEKARIEAEKQAKAEKDAAEKAEKEAQAKIEKEKKDEERAASLTGEDKNIFDSKFQEYKASFEEKEARAKALADVDAAISAREAAAKKAAEAAKAAEENAKKEQAKRAELEKNITEGWDKTDPNSQDNFKKAVHIVANNTNYIIEKDPVWANAESALRKPWDYYGQVVAFTGQGYRI